MDMPLLLIDPYKNLRSAYVLLFEQEGLPVEAAANLEDARGSLAEKRYSLILSELLFPESRDLAFWEEIKTLNPELYLILLTDTPVDEEGYKRIFMAGVDDLIIKPFSPEKLLVHVRRGLRQRDRILEQRLQSRLALTDPISGAIDQIILNTHYFRQCFRKEVKRARRHQDPLSVLLIQTNGTKVSAKEKYNFLTELAGLISKAIREEDTIGREEGGFGLLLYKTGRDGAEVLKSRLSQIVRDYPAFSEKPYQQIIDDLSFHSFTYPEDPSFFDPYSQILQDLNREIPLH